MTTVELGTSFIGAAKVGSSVTGERTAFHRVRTTMVWQTLARPWGAQNLARLVLERNNSAMPTSRGPGSTVNASPARKLPGVSTER